MFKRATRTIEGWTGQHNKIEREGDTLSIQTRTGNGVQSMVIPLLAAQELSLLLPEATALVPAGPVVNDLSRTVSD